MNSPELLAAERTERAEVHATAMRILCDLPPPELGSITLSRNPWAPFAERDTRPVVGPITIAQAFADAGINPDGSTPWVVCLNGEWIRRAEWATREITPRDVALLVALPQGGGKASRIIAGIVMIIIGVIGNIYGGWGTPFIQAGIGMVIGGIAYKKPPVYTPDTYASLANPSPTYNLQAQGNYARLGQPIPVRYGRTRFFPDFGAQPYGDFGGNEQYLYQLFCLGFGEFAIHQLYIEDQPLNGTLGADGYYSATGVWHDIQWQIVPPGGSVTLFPTRVITSDAVSGQEVLNGAPVGAFQIVDADIDQIAIDVVLPRGLYYANDDGKLDAKSITLRVKAQALVQSGAAWNPSGVEFLLGQETISEATNTPQRRSYRYKVQAGRYQVRLERVDSKDTSSRAGHEVNWVGLRGFVPGEQQYGNLTMLAMRMRATDQLSSASSRKINVDATRKIRTWATGTGWSAPVATRSIAAAFLDALTNDEYGLGIDDTRLPLLDLYDLDQFWDWQDDTEGCTFDYGFDRRITAAEALTHIAAAGDCVWYQQGGLVRIRRQQAAGVPVQLFNMRNIRRGSLNITWRLPSSDQPDCIDIWYWDENTNRQEVVRAVLPGGTQAKPQRVDLTGVQRRGQAWRIGMRMLLSSRWHRIHGSLDTEMEGLLSSPGDAIAIAHDMIDRALSAELTAYTGTGKASGNVLTLSEDVDFADAGASYYVEMSTTQGGYSGPWRVVAGAQPNEVVLAEAVADSAYAPQIGGNMERTRINFGRGDKLALKAVLVTPVTVRGSRVTLNWYLDDARAWDLAGGSVPGRNQPFDLALITRPQLIGLNVVWSGSATAPTLDLAWEPSPGALRYFIEISHDGQSWTRLPDATGTTARVPVPLHQIWLRVAAVGSLRGDWVPWSGNPATMQAIPATVTGLALRNPSGGPALFGDLTAQFKWNAAARADGYAVEVWAGGTLRATYGTVETAFDYSQERNRADGGPRRAFELRVRGINGAGQSAADAVLAVSNPQEPATVVQAQQEGKSLLITVPVSTAADHDATEYWLSQAASINPQTEPTVAVSVSSGVTVPAPAPGTWRVWAANRDKFGRDGLNLSPAYVITIIDAASGVLHVPNATTLTATTGSLPPGGKDYAAVISDHDGRMYWWHAELNPARYTRAVDAADIEGRIADAQINVPLLDRIALVDGPTSLAGSVAARIAAEAAQRGTDITNEATIRQTQTDGLAQQISTITAGVAGGFDPGAMWYFDGDSQNWTSAYATVTWNAGWIDMAGASGAAAVLFSPAISITGSQYSVVRLRVKRLAGSGWQGSCYHSTSGHGYNGGIAAKHISMPSELSSIGGTAMLEFDMSALTVGGSDWVANTVTGIRLDLGSTQADAFSIDWIAIGRNAPGASMAGLLEEKTARQQADQAEANLRIALAAQVNDASTGLPATRATMLSENTARANETSALATRATTLEASVAGGGNLLPPMRQWVASANASIVLLAPDQIRRDDSFLQLLPAGIADSPYATGVSLHLKPYTAYTLSFYARTPGGETSTLTFDLYPDTLPETNRQITGPGVGNYTWTFTTGTQAELASCHLRFFHPTAETHIWDVTLVEGALAQAWTLSDASTRARFATVEQAVADESGARATAIQLVDARLNVGGDIKTAIVQVQSEATATTNKLAATYGVTLDAGGAPSGFKNYNDGTTSAFRITANNILMSPGNLVADDGFYSPQWWSAGWVPGGSTVWPTMWAPQDGDGAAQPRRFLRLSAGVSLIAWAGKPVMAAPGESYRVRLRIYRSPDFVGRVFAGMHIPNVAWAMPGPVLTSSWDGGMPHLSNLEGLGSWQTYTGIWTMAGNQSFVQTRIDSEITAGYCEIYLECVLAVGSSLTVEGSIGAREINSAYTNTTVLQARQAVIDYASINSLSALSAVMGDLSSGSITLDDDGGMGYARIRTAGKWLGDGFNGFVMFGRASTQDYGSEFYAASGAASILERKSNGPNIGYAYLTRVVDGSGTERFVVDPANGVYKFRGHIEALSGSFAGSVSALTGTFTELGAGMLYRPDWQTYINLNAYGATPYMVINGATRVWANGDTNWLRNVGSGTWYGAEYLRSVSVNYTVHILVDTGMDVALAENDMRAYTARVRIDAGVASDSHGYSFTAGQFMYAVDVVEARLVPRHSQHRSGGAPIDGPYPPNTQRLFLEVTLRTPNTGDTAVWWDFHAIQVTQFTWWVDKLN